MRPFDTVVLMDSSQGPVPPNPQPVYPGSLWIPACTSLAACTAHAALPGKSPVGLSGTAGLPAETVALQSAACHGAPGSFKR